MNMNFQDICVIQNLQINIFIFNTYTLKLSQPILYFYKISGANEIILVKLNCLNSRGIAPKIRVPFGFPL